MTLKKQYKSPDEIIRILESRGMIFSKPTVAKKHLLQINYFLLKGYNELLLDSFDKTKFKDNCDFNELINLYFFDKELKHCY